MFSRNDPPQKPAAGKSVIQPETKATRSYIAAEVSIRGNVSCSGDLQFDGTIEGDLDCRDLTAGQGATIDGTVLVTKLSLNGKISGMVEAESVHLGPTAQMFGDITYGSLAIDEGATFEGSLNRRRTTADEKITVLRRPS